MVKLALVTDRPVYNTFHVVMSCWVNDREHRLQRRCDVC